jgi:hypothetical protein
MENVETLSLKNRQSVVTVSVTLYETMRLRRFWTFAAGNGETRKGLSLVFAANTRMSDGRRRAA